MSLLKNFSKLLLLLTFGGLLTAESVNLFASISMSADIEERFCRTPSNSYAQIKPVKLKNKTETNFKKITDPESLSSSLIKFEFTANLINLRFAEDPAPVFFFIRPSDLTGRSPPFGS